MYPDMWDMHAGAAVCSGCSLTLSGYPQGFPGTSTVSPSPGSPAAQWETCLWMKNEVLNAFPFWSQCICPSLAVTVVAVAAQLGTR